MGWSIGFDDNWDRDIGYGVPSVCDKPGCTQEIDRGLSYVCGGQPYGGDKGCGLFFCSSHLFYHEFKDGEVVQVCPRCDAYKSAYTRPKPDTLEWVNHKLTHESWQQWRDENAEEVEEMSKLTPQAQTSTGKEIVGIESRFVLRLRTS